MPIHPHAICACSAAVPLVGPCIAYCLCSRVGSVAVAVPAPPFLCFAPLSIVTAAVPLTTEKDVREQDKPLREDMLGT